MAHVVVEAGDLDQGLGFPWPEQTPQGPLRDERRGPILLGRRTWGRRDGSVVLAPSYPFGGLNGDHVVFRWRERGVDRAISLHAWRPLRESVAALREVVNSIP